MEEAENGSPQPLGKRRVSRAVQPCHQLGTAGSTAYSERRGGDCLSCCRDYLAEKQDSGSGAPVHLKGKKLQMLGTD